MLWAAMVCAASGGLTNRRNGCFWSSVLLAVVYARLVWATVPMVVFIVRLKSSGVAACPLLTPGVHVGVVVDALALVAGSVGWTSLAVRCR